MTRLERELLTRIKARLDALDPGAAEKLAVLLPVLRRFAQSYAALGPAAKKTIEALLPELAALGVDPGIFGGFGVQLCFHSGADLIQAGVVQLLDHRNFVRLGGIICGSSFYALLLKLS